MADQNEELQGYVNDMLAVETEMHNAIRSQKEDDRVRRHGAAHQVIARTEEVIDRHMASLKDCLERLGGGESKMKKAIGGVVGAAAGLYDKVRGGESVSRNLRDDYTALCFASVCYEMLHTTALAMKDARTAELALRNLKDLPPLVLAFTEVIPAVVVEELGAQKTIRPDASVAADAVRNTRAAWTEASPTH